MGGSDDEIVSDMDTSKGKKSAQSGHKSGGSQSEKSDEEFDKKIRQSRIKDLNRTATGASETLGGGKKKLKKKKTDLLAPDSPGGSRAVSPVPSDAAPTGSQNVGDGKKKSRKTKGKMKQAAIGVRNSLRVMNAMSPSKDNP